MNFIKNIVNNWKWYKALKKQRKEAAILKGKQEIEKLKSLVHEFNLIQTKESKLPKSKRDFIENKISHLIRTGKLDVKL